MAKENFKQFGLSEELLRSLKLLRFEEPSNVQLALIDAMLKKSDVVVQSQTGSGKTAAYAIPICEMIQWEQNKPQALICVPTRELALQVQDDIFSIGRFKRIKIVSLLGKMPFKGQEKELKQKTHIVVGTVGRILDHLEKGTLDCSYIRFLVVDEADIMFDLGLIEPMSKILSHLKFQRQTVFCSATMPLQVQSLIEKHCRNPIVIHIEEENRVEDRIEQFKLEVQAANKLSHLKEITIVENPDSCIIFANQKSTVDTIEQYLISKQYSVRKLHGGLEQPERISVINDFKSGLFRFLVATDVAARGLDIDEVALIINYDIPLEGEPYVHRIGRTGRFDKTGKAITLYTPTQLRYLRRIELFLDRELQVYPLPTTFQIESARSEFVSKKKALLIPKTNKKEYVNKGILSIKIKAGSKQKIRPTDLVGAISSLETIIASDIGIIRIYDIFSTVEILNHKGNMVIEQLQNVAIKGKLRKVTLYNPNE